MKERTKTILAFSLLGILLLTGFVLSALDRSTDIYPDENTKIMLYGEAHGQKLYYDIENELWEQCYAEGCRNLFVELPYYSAEFLNLWMHQDDDTLMDALFEEIRDTLSGNDDYKAFFRRIKENCPETVLCGTDVGHQYNTTGKRYLQYLEENGFADSEQYALAEACIRQGEEFAAEHSDTGISPVREAYMISNFNEAYERCGSGRIMGIYGSYHTNLSSPDVMAYSLKQQYGNTMSSVALSSIASAVKPYTFGFCISGVVFLLMLLIPNLIWANQKKTEAGTESTESENRLLLMLERIGQAAVATVLLIFKDFNPYIKVLPEGVFIKQRVFFWILAFSLMILYECCWVRYFRRKRTAQDLYAPFAGILLPLATLPVAAALILGIYSKNLILLASVVILGIGHIGIHLQHSITDRFSDSYYAPRKSESDA